MPIPGKSIHQIIATHCTYGNTALNPRKGELEDRPKGYGARKATVPRRDLRKWYQTIEKFLNYTLPDDTPTKEKTSATAQTAPKKFLFVPSTRDYQFVGSVFYRQEDTAGRPGSYFGHVLIQEAKENDTPWSAEDALRLFDWNWVEEDSTSLPDLEELSALPLSGLAKAVDDKLIFAFLSSDDPDYFETLPNGHLIPDRWRKWKSARRRKFLKLALTAALESCKDRKRSALLVCEPEVAIVLFYAISRLLPSSIIGKASFSTFETEIHKRLPVQIAATSFWNMAAEQQIAPEVYKRQIVVNTIDKSQNEDLANSENATYAKFIATKLVASNWADTNEILSAFEAAAPKDAAKLNRLTQAEETVQRLLQDHDVPMEHAAAKKLAQGDKAILDYVAVRLKSFCEEGPSQQALEAILRDEIKCLVFCKLLANDDIYQHCHKVLDRLIPHLLLPVAQQLVDGGRLNVEFVAKIVARRFLQKGHPLGGLSKLCQEVLEPTTKSELPVLANAIKYLEDPAKVFDKTFMASTDAPHAVLFALLKQADSKLDLLPVKKKVFKEMGSNGQWQFLNESSLVEESPKEFLEFLSEHISKLVSRQDRDHSLFYNPSGFGKKVSILQKLSSHLSASTRENLLLANQLCETFDAAIKHKALMDKRKAYGTVPFDQLAQKLIKIYVPVSKTDAAVKSAKEVLEKLNNPSKVSLNERLRPKWDTWIYDEFYKAAPTTTQPPSAQPTQVPSAQPAQVPIAQPTQVPIAQPTQVPIAQPTQVPIAQPTPQKEKSPPRKKIPPLARPGPSDLSTPKPPEPEPLPKPAPLPEPALLPWVADKGIKTNAFEKDRKKKILAMAIYFGTAAVFLAVVIGLVVNWKDPGAFNNIPIGGLLGGRVDTVEEETPGEEGSGEQSAEPTPETEEAPAEDATGEKPAGEKPAGEKPAGEKPAGELGETPAGEPGETPAGEPGETPAETTTTETEIPDVLTPREAPSKNAVDIPLIFFVGQKKKLNPKIIQVNDPKVPEFSDPASGKDNNEHPDYSKAKMEIAEIGASNHWAIKLTESDFQVGHMIYDPTSGELKYFMEKKPPRSDEENFKRYKFFEKAYDFNRKPKPGIYSPFDDERGPRFRIYSPLIQIDNKGRSLTIGINNAIPKDNNNSIESQAIHMVKDPNQPHGVFVNSPSSRKMLLAIANAGLVNKPATWHIRLDKIYERNPKSDAQKLYNDVPAEAFSIPSGNGRLVGLSCKYSGLKAGVQFTAHDAQLMVSIEGDIEKLEDLLNRMKEAKPKEGKDNLGSKQTELKIFLDDPPNKNLEHFVEDHKKITQDGIDRVARLIRYYNGVKKNYTSLHVSLEISTKQEINGVEIDHPFWHKVKPDK
jgi:hypothetical protein